MPNATTRVTLDTEFKDLSLSLANHVAEIEIQRPPHNFFDVSLVRQLADVFTMLDEEPECRAIVLASQGSSFCAGANFGGDSGSGNPDFTEEGFRNTTGILYEEAARLFNNKKPIVGAIQGPAIGGGLGLALVPDFRVVTPEARFAANFVKLGLHQGFGLSVTLPRLIGERHANRMLYSGRRVDGLEALKIGLADALSDLRSLRADALKFAAELAENAPLAVMSVRATLRQGLAHQVMLATAHELKEQQWLRGTADADEGILAVSERRPGNFTAS
jgi:enoyl-CoA hydratase/carnithine racemase